MNFCKRVFFRLELGRKKCFPFFITFLLCLSGAFLYPHSGQFTLKQQQVLPSYSCSTFMAASKFWLFSCLPSPKGVRLGLFQFALLLYRSSCLGAFVCIYVPNQVGEVQRTMLRFFFMPLFKWIVRVLCWTSSPALFFFCLSLKCFWARPYKRTLHCSTGSCFSQKLFSFVSYCACVMWFLFLPASPSPLHGWKVY